MGFMSLKRDPKEVLLPLPCENLLPGSFSSLFTMSSYDGSEEGAHWDHFFKGVLLSC